MNVYILQPHNFPFKNVCFLNKRLDDLNHISILAIIFKKNFLSK